MDQLTVLKPMLYDIIETATNQENEYCGDAKQIIQQQHVGITRAVAKHSDNINIIQMQSVRINNIVSKTIEILKQVDSIKDNYKLLPKVSIVDKTYPREIDYDYSNDPIFSFIELFYNNGIDVYILKDYIRVKYFEFLSRRFPDHDKDAILEMMGINIRSLYRSQKKIKGIFPLDDEEGVVIDE